MGNSAKQYEFNKELLEHIDNIRDNVDADGQEGLVNVKSSPVKEVVQLSVAVNGILANMNQGNSAGDPDI